MRELNQQFHKMNLSERQGKYLSNTANNNVHTKSNDNIIDVNIFEKEQLTLDRANILGLVDKQETKNKQVDEVRVYH